MYIPTEVLYIKGNVRTLCEVASFSCAVPPCSTSLLLPAKQQSHMSVTCQSHVSHMIHGTSYGLNTYIFKAYLCIN